MKVSSDKDNKIGFNTKMKIRGSVRVVNGDTVIEAKNKLVSNWLVSLVSYIGSSSIYGTNSSARDFQLPNCDCPLTDRHYMYLGTNTTTQTVYNTTALSAPIGSPTKCVNIMSGAWTDSSNNRCVSWTGIFPAGTVSGTCGEIGLYLHVPATLTAGGGQVGLDYGTRLCARLAVADSEFESFEIDTSKPVIVTWTLAFEPDGIFTQWMLNTLANLCMASYTNNIYSSAYPIYSPSYNWSGKTSFMVIGTDLSTTNSLSMTTLASPIGTSPGTKASTQTNSTSNPSNGVYKVTWSATWGAGTVSGTCGEIGLYLVSPHSGSLQTAPFTINIQDGTTFFAGRLCDFDGHFEAFSIDTGKALTIDWTISYEFV